jgi:hypothetical protein
MKLFSGVLYIYGTGSGAAFTFDPMLILYSANGTLIAINDDYCSLGSQISFFVPSTQVGCAQYVLHEGEKRSPRRAHSDYSSR